MKKYFLGIAAVVCAIAFSAFTKPFADKTFLLKSNSNPVSAGIVSDDSKWIDNGGTQYGACGTGTDLACKILVDASLTQYFHDDDGRNVLNRADQTPKVDYLEIVETTGLLSGGVQDYKIVSVTPKHWNGTAYETASPSPMPTFANGAE